MTDTEREALRRELDDEDPPRVTDLRPVGLDPRRRVSEPPSARERQLRNSFKDVARSQRDVEAFFDELGSIYGADKVDGLTIEVREPHGDTGYVEPATGTGEPEDERLVRAALHGLRTDDLFRSGKPTAELLERKDEIRARLKAMYDYGDSRSAMATVLGCSRMTLHRLMNP